MKHWLIAILFLIIVVIVWALIFVVMSWALIPVFIVSKFKDDAVVFGKKVLFKSWAHNMFIAQDQAANALLGGSMDTHVSGRVGTNAIRGNKIALNMEKVINLVFKVFAGQENHCRVTIEKDEDYNKDWGG